MRKRAIIKAEKGSVSKPYLTTKTFWRHRPGIRTYNHPSKFEGWCKDLKGFVLDFLGGSNTEKILDVNEGSDQIHWEKVQLRRGHIELPLK